MSCAQPRDQELQPAYRFYVQIIGSKHLISNNVITKLNSYWSLHSGKYFLGFCVSVYTDSLNGF